MMRNNKIFDKKVFVLAVLQRPISSMANDLKSWTAAKCSSDLYQAERMLPMASLWLFSYRDWDMDHPHRKIYFW